MLNSDDMRDAVADPDVAYLQVGLPYKARVWEAQPPTGREWIEMIAAELGVRPRMRVASIVMRSIVGLWAPTLREVKPQSVNVCI